MANRARELVLVGGGHSHVQVLLHLASEPVPNTRLTVVVDTPIAVYSGMVPGFVAGQYRAEELQIDVRPLSRAAEARVIVDRAVGIDAENRRILLENLPDVPYDVASIDIGSTVIDLDLPGIREHALPTRPIGVFVQRVDEVLRKARKHDSEAPFRVIVVGGGAAGVELAFTFRQRLAAETGIRIEVLVLERGRRILSGYPESLVRRVVRRAGKRDIEFRCEREVASAEDGAVTLTDGERIPCQALVWVAGPTSHPVFLESGLPTDDRGFVWIRSTLQVDGHDELFAVGDCATLIDYPRTPKAGVYAVRQGPIITDNLRARLEDGSLRSYHPQSDFLTLLNLGDGTAMGAKWGWSVEGRWVMKLKHRIDRAFMHRFQISESAPPA